ncbi:MAG: glycosyltransferase [Pseudomonadota bacterium]
MTVASASFLMNSLCRPGWDLFLDDLRQQTVTPEQIVVVVDRVTLAEERDAMRRAHPDVDFVFNDANLGVAVSANRGLRKCVGDVVFRIDDDDSCDPRRVELQLEALNATGADIAATFGRGVRGEPRKIAIGDDAPESWLIRCPDSDAALKSALLRRNVLIHSSIAIRRDALDRLGGYDESFRYALDYALYLNAMKHGMTFTVVAEPLVTRFYLRESITVSKRKQQMMFSAAARLLYAADQDDSGDFIGVMWRRGWLLAAPNWARRVRRRIFEILGLGA